jgi:hypothetical protein
MAISDDGAWLLAATSASVTLFNANGGSRQLLGTGPYPQVAFAAGSHDAAIADGYVAGLVLFHDVAGASTQQSLDTPDDIRHSGAVAFSTDGGKLFVAVPEQQSVVGIDTASGVRTASACNCTLSGLTPMGAVLRLNEAGNGPLWLLDAGTPSAPRVVFVPALVAQ